MLILKISMGIVLAYIGVKGAGVAMAWLKEGFEEAMPTSRRKKYIKKEDYTISEDD